MRLTTTFRGRHGRGIIARADRLRKLTFRIDAAVNLGQGLRIGLEHGGWLFVVGRAEGRAPCEREWFDALREGGGWEGPVGRLPLHVLGGI